MARRREARQVALQLLYQHDLNPDISQQSAREMLDERIGDGALREFAWQLYVGTCDASETLDRRIQDIAVNWKLSRIAPTDRNLIRMGVYEMESLGTPAAVVLDECIELAKSFGSPKSGEFVNGILDKLIPDQADIETHEEDDIEVPS